MADDLISRQAAIKLLEEWADGYSYLEVPVSSIEPKLNELPAAEKKGEWMAFVNEDGELDLKCSICGEEQGFYFCYFNYCPNCGAKMEET